MKILQIINSLSTGGAEKLLLDTIPLYRKAGIEMDVLVFWDNDFPFLKKLQQLDCCKIYILKKTTGFKDVYNPLHIFKIRKILKKYDLVHVHLFPALYFAVFANIGLGKKMIFTEHSTTNKRIQNKVVAMFDRLIYKGYSNIIAISDDVLFTLNKHISFQKDKIVKIENGVDVLKINTAKFYKKYEIHSSFHEHDFILCQVSAFRKGKDQKTLIRALSLLPKEFKLILVGDGDRNERASVELLVKNLALEDRVIFAGTRMDVASIIKSTDVNILSSDFEGLSLSSIEGLASGKPFIASDVPGLQDIVGGAGLLFNGGDAEALAHQVLMLYNDKTFYNKITKQCLERASIFDINKMVNSYIELYKRLLTKEIYQNKI